MSEGTLIKGEEKLWSDIKNYPVVTNNARVLGKLIELIINEKNGKIIEIVIELEDERNIAIRGAKRKDNYLLVPFSSIERVGDFIMIRE